MTLIQLPREAFDENHRLSDAAWRTFTEACYWSTNRQLDGLIPINDVRRFANTPDPAAAITELIDKEWIYERGENYELGEHSKLLLSRERQERRRAGWREKKRRQREKKREERQRTTTTSASHLISSQTFGGDSPDGLPPGTGDEWDE